MSPPGAQERGRGAGAMLFIAIGVVALGFAAWQGARTLLFVRSAERAEARVLADVPGSTRPITAGHPTLAFATKDGREVRFRLLTAGPARVGATMPVLYAPGDPPGSARAADAWGLWGGTLLPLIMGAGFLGLSLAGVEIGLRGR